MLELGTVVIGAGVVGLAVAERLSRDEKDVLVLERNDAPGLETTSRNSQVVHAGMYYPTDSLKASLCVRGNRSLVAWCEAHRVPHALVGKLIVATESHEEPELERILTQGRSNGVESLELKTADFVHQLEPEVRATAALWSPRTGIVDAHALVGSLLEVLAEREVIVARRHRVASVRPGYELEVETPEGPLVIRAERVVNAAGLEADSVAALTGLDVDAIGYRLHYVKGNYFRVRARGRIRHLVYPVPAKHLTGLGVHVTVGLDGDVRLGPDVEMMEGRAIDYAVDETRLHAFFASASRFLPFLEPELLAPDQSGVRPKLSREAFRDFVITEESARGLPGWVNLIGIESPGLTCVFELGERVAGLL